MHHIFRPALKLFAVLTLLTGVVYPALVTVVAQRLFPKQAGGSLIYDGDRVIGSELIGQPFDEAKYFWSRPSATAPAYNGAASSGSNLGPTNPALIAAVESRVRHLRTSHPDQTGAIPVDLVTASASGLDPHISLAAAEFQAGRVAQARGLSRDDVLLAVAKATEHRTLRVLGEPRISVLQLNRLLDGVGVPSDGSSTPSWTPSRRF